MRGSRENGTGATLRKVSWRTSVEPVPQVVISRRHSASVESDDKVTRILFGKKGAGMTEGASIGSEDVLRSSGVRRAYVKPFVRTLEVEETQGKEFVSNESTFTAPS